MCQVTSEKSQAPQTESAAKKKKIMILFFLKGGMCTKHKEKKTLCRAGRSEELRKFNKKISHFLKGGIFRASAGFSSPNLGLVSLKKTRMVHWPRTVV